MNGITITRTQESDPSAIRVTGIDEVMREVSRILKTVSGPDMRYRVAMAGSPYVLMKYNYFTYPNRQMQRVHYFYGVPILRGNWSQSIEEISQRRRRIKVAGIAVVGPRYNTKSHSKQPVGKSAEKSWANYAHMIYGSARAYQQRVTFRVLDASAPLALPAMLNESKKIFNQATGRA